MILSQICIIIFHVFQVLEDKEKKQSFVKDNLHREQRYLRRRLEQLLNEQNIAYRVRNERSISECSNSTTTSTSSTSESGEYFDFSKIIPFIHAIWIK
jgi:hypothetical protein